jgi:PAS domain S-box-containing protein
VPTAPGPEHDPTPDRRGRLTPFRIVLIYAAFGLSWIMFSDMVLSMFVRDPLRRDQLQSVKGATFIVVTAALLFHLIRRNLLERRALDEQLRTVLDGMADGVFVVDPAGNIVDVNATALAMLGASDREQLLVPLDDYMRRFQVRRLDGRPVTASTSSALRALAGEEPAGYEARMQRLDGRDLFVSVTSTLVRTGRYGRPLLAVSVLRDITEVKRFEEMREQFLATAAHEFKTPLAVVKAYAQLMRRRQQGDPAGLDVMARQIDRLTRMTQQLLEVSRFRLGGGELLRERFDLAVLLREIAEEVRPQADRHTIVLGADGAATVVADRDRIAQVITNLMENAIRFSPIGGAVEAALAARDGEAVVSIHDHGVGIPAERQDRIFERYYRAHAGTGEDYSGLGIGLDVSREIVARHGGRIWFASTPGEGSTFSFSLPLAVEERP